MRKNKGLLTLGITIVLVTSSLYAIYSSIGGDGGPRHAGLGSLLDSSAGANVAELTGPGAKQVIDVLQYSQEWGEAVSFLSSKGFQLDAANIHAYQIKIGGYVLSVLRQYTSPSENMSIAEVVLVRDDDGRNSAWILVTNLPLSSLGEYGAGEIPVFTFSNGMPVFFVTFYHLVEGEWIPYNYWWHSAHNHPNWYYSVYRFWWQYYDWHYIDWPFWYDGFLGWYYDLRFCYWSTYFPIGEASGALLALWLVLGIFRLSLRRR